MHIWHLTHSLAPVMHYYSDNKYKNIKAYAV